MAAQTQVPRVNDVIVTPDGRMNQYCWGLFKQVSPNPNQTVGAQAVGASPYTYTNNTGYALTALVTGGTVSNVAFGRAGVFTTIAGATGTQFLLSPGDSIRLTYTVLPTLTLIPR